MNEIKDSSSIERFANVNTILMEAYSLKCLNFKYDKFIQQLSEVEFNKTDDSGGVYYFDILKYIESKQ